MKQRLVISLAASFVLLALAAPAWAGQPSSPVTIETAISFAEFPFSGTFAVVEGADTLGCSGGTFVDHPFGFGAIRKAFECTQGANQGTFTFVFRPGPGPGSGDGNGHWAAYKGTQDFSGLRGQGDFSVTYTGVDTGMEILTGVVHYEP